MSDAPRQPAPAVDMRAPTPESLGPELVSPVYLMPLLAEAVHRQLGVQPLFRGSGMEAGDLDAPGALISHAQAINVVRRALRVMPMAGLGLALGRRALITERGVLALGLLAAATLGDAIRLALQFAGSAGYLLQVREATSAAGHAFIAAPFAGDEDVQGFLVDLTFSASVQLHRQITGADYAPSAVDLVCGRPADAAGHEAFYGCPVRFGSLRNALHTQPAWCDFALPWANGTATRLATQLLQRDAERLNAAPAIGFSVERSIRRRLPDVDALAQLAASLNLSERTLRRQLAQAGLSYRQLLDEGRKARAFDLVSAGHRSLGEIAIAAGFSDARAFTRAFRRWTGQSPVAHGFAASATHPWRPGLG
jgi:AraC-like DNA-binding protein